MNYAEKLYKKLIKEGASLIGFRCKRYFKIRGWDLCLYGHDMDINKSPVEANLKMGNIKKRILEGGFIGSEKIKSQIEKGVSKFA